MNAALDSATNIDPAVRPEAGSSTSSDSGLGIFLAAALGDPVRVETLLARDPALANARDLDGRTPLMLALQRGHRDVLAVLLRRGADANAVTPWGDTPLHQAARWGEIALLGLLLEHGADARARDLWGKTPVERALQFGHHDAARALGGPSRRWARWPL